MMAPHHERLRVLHQALDCAGAVLDQPIDRIEVGRRTIEVRAGPQSLVLTYGYQDSYDARGNALLGGGQWTVTAGPVRRGAGSWLAGRLRRLARLWR